MLYVFVCSCGTDITRLFTCGHVVLAALPSCTHIRKYIQVYARMFIVFTCVHIFNAWKVTHVQTDSRKK